MYARIRSALGYPSIASPWDSDEILREELFSIARLEQHAASLARAQETTAHPLARPGLHDRLRDNEAILLRAHRVIAKAVGDREPVTPAAEWLLDNYHLVEEQIHEIRDDLPPGFYRRLPKLAHGPFVGYPRVFGLTWAFVAHTDSRFEPETLRSFVRAYQAVQPLTIGELWAVAITLRIVLVENLRRAAQRIIASRAGRRAADDVADRLLGMNGHAVDPGALPQVHDHRKSLVPAFAVQLVQRLRDQDPRETPALLWLDERLAELGTTADGIVADEHQRQGAANVTVRNIITSMRLISDVDWSEFFESVSLVDEQLRAAGDFGVMDFATRNLYRSAIEELARGSALTESSIVERVLSTARAGTCERERDPGYHLIAGGRRKFESALGYRPSRWDWRRRISLTVGAADYIAAIVVTAAGVLAIPLLLLHAHGVHGASLALFAVLGVIPGIDVAVALVNRAVARGLGPTILPGLALREGVPESSRTLIAVPVLLTTHEAIAEQIERLEIHYLASAEGELYFALLSDWTDAATERVAGDELLLAAALEGIRELNRRYGAGSAGERFVLLHRHRLWSTVQRCWMGWERKRGKLHELNQLLRGATTTSFLGIDGRVPWVPPDVRYVLTLDADTRLPRESARRLIGKMAHPLNRPRFDPTGRRVLEGYAVLQPRVTPSLPIGYEGSIFQRVFSSTAGIDPYAAAVSDVYQDLLGEGSYAGKGIYDVDAFESALAGRVPEGTLLSHDLFEGIFARAGLASDVEVVDAYPARYDVAALRQHRWARGDWQLLPWLLGRRDAATGEHYRDAIPLIGKWKMLDNLRRTLSAPASVAALVAGWTLPMHASLAWTVFVLAALAVPTLLPVWAALIPRHTGITARSHMRAFRIDLSLALSQAVLLATLLAHQSWLMSDAIGRTLFRLGVSHRNLLDWITAEQTRARAGHELRNMYRGMSGGIGVAIVGAGVVAAFDAGTWWIAAPMLLLWIAAPAVAFAISRAPALAGPMLPSAADERQLRLIARRTWRYFETFVSADENMVPPDNFQEDPRPAVAHRTSPTNLGVYLLSVVAARDFGWSGTLETVERLEATLASMARMQRFRGHFFNWYDTRDLRPLEPRYISSVDSGNLAAHLITLANACREWRASPLPPPAACQGLGDAVDIARAAALALPDDLRTQAVTRQQIGAAIDDLEAALQACAPALNDFPECLADAVTCADILVDSAQAAVGETDDDAHAELLFWATASRRAIASRVRDLSQSGDALGSLKQRLDAVVAKAVEMATTMEFGFLVDPERKLLSIGYRPADGMLDPSCYDLLASEARLASFVAIAKGDVPARHWFRLGRSVTAVGPGAALLSWSGSMFEYLMPSLVMRAPAGSLLEQTSRLIVRRQMEYGAALRLPWGVSESGYNARDLEFTYQYSNFGVPGLGLKRALGDNIVIAPYATALATMVNGRAAVRNFERLTALGAAGRYGFYEAIDFTTSRLPEGEQYVVVRAYMAHHQGMTIVAIANTLHHARMRERFHAEPSVRATELLLQERAPRDVSLPHQRTVDLIGFGRHTEAELPAVRRFATPHTATPQVHLLSNGRYAVLVTAAGSGYSRWRDLGVTRWREDSTCDDAGSYIFLRDMESSAVWSAGYQPCGVEPDHYRVAFSEDRAEFVRSDAHITTTLEILVSPEDDAEVRRVSITNLSNRIRDIEVTSYAELVLGNPAADTAHPAFSKLFVRTEHYPRLDALLATRRRREATEPEIWAIHHAVVEGDVLGKPEYETDRARFLGRGHGSRAPVAVVDGRRLSNSTGAVLDPVFVLRHRVRVPAGATARITFWTGVAQTREQAIELLEREHDVNAFARVVTLAWTQARVQLHHFGIDAAEANLFQQLAGHILFAGAALRPPSKAIRECSGDPSALWSAGISGDLPIVLLRIASVDDIAFARQLLQAHEYWRIKQIAVDLVILNEQGPSYLQELQTAIDTLIRMSLSRSQSAGAVARGSVFSLRTELISVETRQRLTAVARVVLVARRGSLMDQLDRVRAAVPMAPALPGRRPAHARGTRVARKGRDLEFFNGLGGFAAEGREYAVVLGAGETTPAPWINIVANPQFGFQVAAEGSGYTWASNSRENALTPWSNDPVTDRSGEAIYVRDDETGALWGPTAQPIRDTDASYRSWHGQGYSRFEQTSNGIVLELTLFVAMSDPIKICRLKLRNVSGRRRALSVTAYVEWVLGSSRVASATSIETEIDDVTGALFARNPWNAVYGTRVAFVDLAGRQSQWTADRQEFLGRHGTLAQPAALLGSARLSGRVGAGFDACAALQTAFEIESGATAEAVFFLGQAASVSAARTLLLRFRAANVDDVLREVIEHWDTVLGMVQVKTPDRSMDVILNRWLLYQTIACRMWARAAFYQAGGGFGFRDQLQDSMALGLATPALAREHLLRAAGRQFPEGDVQHWWLPQTGQGVRTRISDDRAWLAYVTAHYIAVTGDEAVLDVPIAFLDGPLLRASEHEAFFQPGAAHEAVTLFEHCALGLDSDVGIGAHGLPLIGTGDWNDGMNRVGESGRGESVWLGWFLFAALKSFAQVAQARGAHGHASRWLTRAARLQEALEASGWDGDWYRRGYFDDGTPLGSASSAECRIDSIAQSWAVISGAADPMRATRAIASVQQHLIRRGNSLALLFTPPFDRSPLDPGYVKAYPPGVRENGGQYSHAAAWSVVALTMLGEGDKATELFSFLNPINRASTRADAHRYRVEPYVMAADVYSELPHVGRGGWTWYTGAAAWSYRAGLECILGFRVRDKDLQLDPCIPRAWPRFAISYRYGSSRYEIRVENPHGLSHGVAVAELDGLALAARPVIVDLVDDGRIHQVDLVLGPAVEQDSIPTGELNAESPHGSTLSP